MSIRVSPTAIEPTHHFSLSDRRGRRLGLTACDETGNARPLHDERVYLKQPVDTTANKQTSGGSSYQDFDYPYTPIVQNDLSGGRGSKDFERDSTKYWDSFRCQTGMSGKAYAGPLEQYVTGIRTSYQNMPANVRWISLLGSQRTIYRKVTLSSGAWTAAELWLLARRTGKPAALTVELRNDNDTGGGAVGTLIQSATFTRLETDLISEWMKKTITQAFVSATYWIVLKGADTDSATNHWKVAVNSSASDTYSSASYTATPTSAGYSLIYRLIDETVEKNCIGFEYKEQQYFVVSGVSVAPALYMAGARGAADSNAGTLGKLIDAAQSWSTNKWAGAVVMIIDGPGFSEAQNWRAVKSNTATELTVDHAWQIPHNTNTQYVIISPKVTMITGHGLTQPVTDVYVSTTGVVYFCMGSAATARRMREYNNSGTWTMEFAAEDAATKPDFMVYKPLARKIVIGRNTDPSNNVSVSVMSNTSVPVWGTNLTFAAPIEIDSPYRKITGMTIYPDESGNEAVWVFKTDLVFVVTGFGDVYPINIDEMKTVRSTKNGVRPLKHNLYLYFPLLQGLERFYGGQVDDVGPNIGDGLPLNRRGPIVSMVGYPAKLYIAVNAGNYGYSSILHSGGWHEIYRAPKGEQIKNLFFQVSPGAALDRMWVWQGNDLLWLPFPSETTQDLEDEAYLHCYEFSVTLSRMQANLYDVQKLIKKIKIQSDALEVSTAGAPVCWFEADYRLNDDEEWTTIATPFTVSPNQEADFTDNYGIAGKRAQFRIRGYTSVSKKSPIFLAIVVSAVIRTDIKSFYGPFQFRIMDDEPVGLRDTDSVYTAAQKLKILEDWSDSDNDSMLLMRSVSELCDDKMIFLNLGTRRHVRFAGASGNENKTDVYVVGASMQEA